MVTDFTTGGLLEGLSASFSIVVRVSKPEITLSGVMMVRHGMSLLIYDLLPCKYSVLVIELRMLAVGDKELRGICIWSTICHRNNSSPIMLNWDVQVKI